MHHESTPTDPPPPGYAYPPQGPPQPQYSYPPTATVRQKINGDMWKLIFQIAAIMLAALAVIYTNKSDIAVIKTKIDLVQIDMSHLEVKIDHVKPDLLRSEVVTAKRDANIALNQASSHGIKLDDINLQLTTLYAQLAVIQKDIHESTWDRFTGEQGEELERRIDALEKN